MPRTFTRPRNLWGKKILDDDVWTLAKERCRNAFEQFDHVAVMFSGGKDSTVMLAAAVEVAEELGELPLRTVFWDEEAIPFETEDYVRRVAQDSRIALEWYCLPVQHRNACSSESAHWWCWAPEAEELWCRPLPPEAITELAGFPMEPPDDRPSVPQAAGLVHPPRLGSVGMLMGIRADESLIRRRAVSNRHRENWIIRGADGAGWISKVYPVYDMTTDDIWTCIAKLSDYNPAYDLMEMVGISHAAQRCAPPYGEEPMQSLWVFKQCFPDVWPKVSARVPGADAAARYAGTELYSIRPDAERPEGVTWQQWIREVIEDRHEDPHMQQYVAWKVKYFIENHYRKTSDPILDVPHPISGLSWPFLVSVAYRGNLKNRRWPTSYNEAYRPQYEAALAEYRKTNP